LLEHFVSFYPAH